MSEANEDGVGAFDFMGINYRGVDFIASLSDSAILGVFLSRRLVGLLDDFELTHGAIACKKIISHNRSANLCHHHHHLPTSDRSIDRSLSLPQNPR